jgi:hypothetical protein
MNSVVERIGGYILYGLVGIYVTVEKCCECRRPRYETVDWQAINYDRGATQAADTYHELDRTDADVVFHNVRKSHGLHDYRKTVVHWGLGSKCGYDISEVFEDTPKAPWFFVGYIDSDGKTIDCTEIMDQLVVNGNHVTTQILRYVSGVDSQSTWVYVNPRTFDQIEFPSEGILIGDADAAPASSTKVD